MSDIIQLLPESVANQIAAGEVIQRPASVIKELMENSIDAGATRIDVVVIDAGKTSIQVVDDGSGMTPGDAHLAFERHATSKIRKADDLFSLNTMGFRGEALASIAAVAQAELRTRTETDEIGIKLEVAGSKIESEEPDMCPKGCNFTVRNLFYNVPARRRFLKSDQTELNNIMWQFERIALVYPEITFTLTNNGVDIYNLPSTNERMRIIHIFGKKMNKDLLNLELKTTMVQITGFVGRPDSARKRNARQFLFVNGRYMKHPYFHSAIMSAYENLIPADEKIHYFLYFTIDPKSIDVNIHPTKTEIKFEDEKAMWQIISAAVKETLGKYNQVPSIDFDVEDRPDIPVFDDEEAVEAPHLDFDPGYNPFEQQPATIPSAAGTPIPSKAGTLIPSKANTAQTYNPGETHHGSTATRGWEQLFDEPADTPQMPDFTDTPDEQGELALEGIKNYGGMNPQHYQYKNKFIMTSVKSGLMIIDQHRAHIRVLYEDYMKKDNGNIASQGLLFPVTAEIPSSDRPAFIDVIGQLEEMGFELTDTGQGNWQVNAVPAGVQLSDPAEFMTAMAHRAATGGDIKQNFRSVIALGLAGASAIPCGRRLSSEEMSDLVERLLLVPTPNYTPDGLKVITVVRDDIIEKYFD